VVPFEKERDSVLERYFSNEALMRMQDFLSSKVLAGMAVAVVNPVYERIRLKFNVKFKAGYNERLAFSQLSDKINGFLNPWNNGKIAGNGGIIPASVILNEIDLEESVDYVTNFSVFHIVNNEIINLNSANRKDLIISARSPISVLIPDKHHKLLAFNDQIATDKPGINDMMIGNDFLIKTGTSGSNTGLGFEALGKSFRLSPPNDVFSTEKHTFTLYVK
jgi:hypothetical protein